MQNQKISETQLSTTPELQIQAPGFCEIIDIFWSCACHKIEDSESMKDITYQNVQSKTVQIVHRNYNVDIQYHNIADSFMIVYMYIQ